MLITYLAFGDCLSHTWKLQARYLGQDRSKFKEIGHLKENLAGGNLHTSECNSTKYKFVVLHVIGKATPIMSKIFKSA